MLELNNVYFGDCLYVMQFIDDKSIDFILTDMPYGTTKCKWDTVLDLEKLWLQFWRIIKPNGAIALTGKQPFTSVLVQSCIKYFRYELIWQKEKGVDFGHVNNKPLNEHENILVFYKKSPKFNKQFVLGQPYVRKNNRTNSRVDLNFSSDNGGIWVNAGTRTVRSVIKIARDNAGVGNSLYPTQKPVALFELLIKMYTNAGDTVLDCCCGSGTTGVACTNLQRNFILIDNNPEAIAVCEKRLQLQHTTLENSYV